MKNVINNDETLERTQQLILTKNGSFNEKDKQRVLDLLSFSAEQHLKMRPSRSGGVVKVRGEGEVQGNMLLMKVEIPMDSRYKQTPEAIQAFNEAWSNAVHRKLGVTSGGFVPANLR